MNIEDIENPQFLKDASIQELEQLAHDIRSFLIESLSKTGGHLSSNLGIVELTIALHKVFDSPSDKFLFDVGHQSYVHKILTGRAKQFDTLRQFGGISGFQKRNESEYDCFEAGHSSTALSTALGFAIDRDLNHQSYEVVAIVGDGSMISGESLEALNHMGQLKKKMIIIFNDNNMSIGSNVGSLTHAFAKLRTSKSYVNTKNDLRKSLANSKVGRATLNTLYNVKSAFKEATVDSGIFGEFGLDYLGPVDGHNIKELIRTLEVAKAKDEGPVLVHVLTKKGKGAYYCEQDKVGAYHGVGPFDPVTGKAKTSTAVGYKSWSSVITTNLLELAKKNEDIIAITPAMIHGSALDEFFATFPQRSFDTGISEEHATSMAAGIALGGKRPFLDIYSSFLQRSYDQINHDICRMDLPVVIGIDRAGLVGEDGPTHHGVFDIGILRALPNMILAQPKDAYEAGALLDLAFKQDHPFAIRFPRGSTPYKPYDGNVIELGSWEYMKATHEIGIIITYGNDVIKIRDYYNHEGISVINARFFKPLDTKMLDDILSKDVPIMVYEGDMLACGLGSAILEYSNDHHYMHHISRVGIGDNYVTSGSIARLKTAYAIDYKQIDKWIECIKKRKQIKE